MHESRSFRVAALAACLISLTAVGAAAATPQSTSGSYTVAVLPFDAQEHDSGAIGRVISTLISAELSRHPELVMVERSELDKALAEVELSLAGAVSPASALQVGQLTGVRILVFGRAISVGDELTLIAKIIGTETTRLLAESTTVAPGDSSVEAARALADRIATAIRQRGEELVAADESADDTLEELMRLVEGRDLPTISVQIDERHVGRPVLDPAAETEVGLLLKNLGFELIDPDLALAPADIELTGEAFSEFGLRRGNVVSCKGRVEVRATERATGRVLAIDRQNEVALDVSEEMAGKAAVQQAAARVAQRIVPHIVGSLEGSAGR